MTPIRLIILGATGSIGQAALRVIQEHRELVTVEGLVAQKSGSALWAMAQELDARWVCLTDSRAASELTRSVGDVTGPEILSGLDALLARIEGAPSGTQVLSAMSGFSGLVPTLAALERGFRVLLANKETMVAAGDLVTDTALRAGSEIIPVDSEHSAIFQCLGRPQAPYRRLILTCSGGPFRGWDRKQLAAVGLADALKHPNWSMGDKITIDSATLMNKGLELIEAHHLFQVTYDRIDVVVHPESIIHSLVEFVDGATMAQLGWPDMRVPIQVALSWPERWSLSGEPLDLTGRRLTFEPPDLDTFPALAMARQAGEAGGLYPTILNAANEVAVSAFLSGRIPFLRIVPVVEEVLGQYRGRDPAHDIEVILSTDHWARQEAETAIAAYIRR